MKEQGFISHESSFFILTRVVQIYCPRLIKLLCYQEHVILIKLNKPTQLEILIEPFPQVHYINPCSNLTLTFQSKHGCK